MINSIETYTEAGRKAATAARERDPGRANSWHWWFNQARALEAPADKPAAGNAFREGYRGASRTSPIYFTY